MHYSVLMIALITSQVKVELFGCERKRYGVRFVRNISSPDGFIGTIYHWRQVEKDGDCRNTSS